MRTLRYFNHFQPTSGVEVSLSTFPTDVTVAIEFSAIQAEPSGTSLPKGIS